MNEINETTLDNAISERNSNDSTYGIDHHSDLGDARHAEAEDTNANPEGVYRQGPSINADLPLWVYEEFDVREHVNKGTGEVQLYLNPKASVVRDITDDAPNRIVSGMDNMSDENFKLANQLAADMRNYMETALAVDEYFANAPLFHLRSELANTAVRATRFLRSLQKALARVKPGAEVPEWIEGRRAMIVDMNARCAILSVMLGDLEPDFKSKMKYGKAAWDIMGYDAYKLQEQHLRKRTATAQNEDELNATLSLAAGL